MTTDYNLACAVTLDGDMVRINKEKVEKAKDAFRKVLIDGEKIRITCDLLTSGLALRSLEEETQDERVKAFREKVERDIFGGEDDE